MNRTERERVVKPNPRLAARMQHPGTFVGMPLCCRWQRIVVASLSHCYPAEVRACERPTISRLLLRLNQIGGVS